MTDNASASAPGGGILSSRRERVRPQASRNRAPDRPFLRVTAVNDDSTSSTGKERTMAWKAGIVAALGPVLAAGAGLAQQEQGGQTATGTYLSADGAEIGTVTLTETPNGVLIVTAIDGLPEGVHAYHI